MQHCSDEDYSVTFPSESNLMSIILVKRGECSFASKVKVAEAKGAAAVIIVDKKNSLKDAAKIQATIMADDEKGTGSNVKIPSILVSNLEGERLLKAVVK